MDEPETYLCPLANGSMVFSRSGSTGESMSEPARKYRFSWKILGDIGAGRPNLGPVTRLEMYRLLQYTFRDVLEQEFGTEKTDEIFFRAGKLAGREFYANVIGHQTDLNAFIGKLQQVLAEMNVGILRIEQSDPEKGSFVMTVSEDLDCSGLPETGYGVCTYDEGFIAGLMESFTGVPFEAKEIDCWCTGDRTCRFAVNRRLASPGP